MGSTLRDPEESGKKTKYLAGEKEQEFLVSPGLRFATAGSPCLSRAEVLAALQDLLVSCITA